MPIYAKLTIARLPLGQHVRPLRSDSILLCFPLMVGPKTMSHCDFFMEVFSFWEVKIPSTVVV